mgnify:CR=1 FL=1|tara:strand:+ start:1284 stop:2339 length:1056 start_codon:yes stop_codon:yes gene_type:complete
MKLQDLFVVLILLALYSCAQIVSPTGGEKDITKPKLVNTSIEKLDNEVKIKFNFDESIQFNNWNENFYISPPINNTIEKKIKSKSLSLSFSDSLLNKKTYNFCLNNAIKDMTEGNIIDSLNYLLNLEGLIDTINLSGKVLEAKSLKPLKKIWVVLHENNVLDSNLFEKSPEFVTKTNEDGNFIFPNLPNKKKYEIYALNKTEYFYDKKNIAFHDKSIETGVDTFVKLFSFNLSDTLYQKNDTSNNVLNDSVLNLINGNIIVNSNLLAPCILQLIENETLVREEYFYKHPLIIKNVLPGSYSLKYIEDSDLNKKWSNGSLQNKLQPERVLIYKNKLLIRENWDLEIDWNVKN